MKALVYTGPGQLEYREVAEAEAAPGEVLVAVEAVGICGSDLHAWQGHDARRPPPLILGHEAAGIVLGGAQDGARVTVNPLVTCGTCPDCLAGRDNLCPDRQILSMPPRAGAFAERIAIPARNLVHLPKGLPAHHAAFCEPLACGWHAIRLALQVIPDPGEPRVAIIGGGAIGIAAALSAAARGLPEIHIAETNPARHDAIRAAGPFAVYNPRDAEPEPGSFAMVIDAHGDARSRAAASRLVRPGGVIVHVGLAAAGDGLDLRRITLQEITVIGSYTYTRSDFRAAAAALIAGTVGDLGWIERRPLEAGPGAVEELASGRASAPKITLVP